MIESTCHPTNYRSAADRWTSTYLEGGRLVTRGPPIGEGEPDDEYITTLSPPDEEYN